MKYQKLIRRDTQSSDKICQGRAVFVHVCPRDGQDEGFGVAVHTAEIAVRFFAATHGFPMVREEFDKKPAGVVPVPGIFGARIS